MPVCNCEVHNCSGQNISNRQWKAHQRDDILFQRAPVHFEGSSAAVDSVRERAGILRPETQIVEGEHLGSVKWMGQTQVLKEPSQQSSSLSNSGLSLPPPSNTVMDDNFPSESESRINYIKKQIDSMAMTALDPTNMEISKFESESAQHEKAFLAYQKELEETLIINSPLSSYALKLSHDIDDRLTNLANFRQDLLYPASKLFNTSDSLHSHSLKHSDPLLVTSLILPMVSHLVGGIPRAQANAQIRGNVLLLKLAAKKFDAKDYQRLLDNHPKDVRSVRKHLSLDPEVTVYATCPNCSCIHSPVFSGPRKPDKGNEQRSGQYPVRCSHTPFPNNPDIEPCKGELLKNTNNTREYIPLRPFVYQDPKDFLHRMLSRPDIKLVMDESWSKPAETDYLTDIFQAKVCQNFVGPDGKTFKETSGMGRGNYLFALSIDWFNPYTNKIAGPVASVGAVTLVCLNLPPSIRYKAENICLVGLIPGPSEPSREEVDHFLTPLIQTFKEFWDPGVYYTWTSLYRTGKLVRMGIVPLIADMKGVRKVSGNAQCQICHLSADEVKIGPLRQDLPPSLPDEEYRRLAEEWKNASDFTEREKCYTRNGIRWSAFLELPYWRTGSFAVIDAMHALFLGVIPTHFRHIYGMAGKEADLVEKKNKKRSENKSKNILPFNEFNFARGQSLLEAHSPLSRLHHATLKELCRLYLPQEQRLGPAATNKGMIDVLTTWRGSIQHFERKERTEATGVPIVIPERTTEPVVHLKTTKSSKEFEIQDYIEAEKTLLSSDSLLPTSFDRRRLASLKVLCETYIPVDILKSDPDKIHTKQSLSGMLFQWKRQQQTIIQKRVMSNLYTPPVFPMADHEHIRKEFQNDDQDVIDVANDIIDSKTILEIRSDIRRTIVPSWITPLSPYFGSKKGGKLKAAEWRIAATVYLPITLIRVWSGSIKFKKFLDNTMDMISAIILITSYEITPRHAAEYTKYVQKYLKSLQELFPNLKFRDNHHVILHLEELVNLFGPVHTWWAFPFERVIGILEKFNTNWKLGEMEKTIMTSFCAAANLRAFLRSRSHNSSLNSCLEEIRSIFTGSAAGGIFEREIEDIPGEKDDSLKRRLQTLSPEELEALAKYLGSDNVSLKVHSCRITHHKGLRYSSRSAITRDSFIVFKDGENVPIPAQIESIITYDTTLIPSYLSVRRYSEAQNIFDPFRSFPVLKAGLYKKLPNKAIEVISLNELWCHFAQCPYDDETIVILPLDRTYPRDIEMNWE